MWTDEERGRLEHVKHTARQREPLPDEQAIALDLYAACRVLADYLFTHPNPAGWTALATAAAQGSDEFGIVLMVWSSSIGVDKQP